MKPKYKIRQENAKRELAKVYGQWKGFFAQLPEGYPTMARSSEVEQTPVKRKIVGSIPTEPAK